MFKKTYECSYQGKQITVECDGNSTQAQHAAGRDLGVPSLRRHLIKITPVDRAPRSVVRHT